MIHVPLATKVSVAAGTGLAAVGTALAQVTGQQQQLADHLPMLLWQGAVVVGVLGAVVAVAKALWALHGVAVKWVEGIATVRVLKHLNEHAQREEEQLSSIRETLAAMRGELRVVRISLGGDPYPTPPAASE